MRKHSFPCPGRHGLVWLQGSDYDLDLIYHELNSDGPLPGLVQQYSVPRIFFLLLLVYKLKAGNIKGGAAGGYDVTNV